MTKFKTTIIIFGDIAALYISLISTLIIRYGQDSFKEPLTAHLKPFSLIFLVWILIFYLFDLYKAKNLRIDLKTVQNFFPAIIISVAVSAIFFYLFPSLFKLTPKTNLAIFALIFGILDFSWRFVLINIYISKGLRNRLLFVGDSPIIDEAVNYLKNNPQLGYDVVAQTNEYLKIENYQADTVVIQPYFKKDPEFIKTIYRLLPKKIAVIDLITFYENIFQKLPLKELEEGWFIEKIATRRHFYDAFKRIAELALFLILGVALLPIVLIISVLIKLTSKGPVIYKQERTGLNNNSFTLYKFRTMKINETGPLWTDKNDKRLTLTGKIIRHAHLDELPQLYNILKGDISFIGPRAERKELAELYGQIPYYEIRHIIKPGLTGWAQVNYKPSASVEEAAEKLQYDIYYTKNRSLILDFLILLKTIKYLFVSLK